jgi:hypothetical protein
MPWACGVEEIWMETGGPSRNLVAAERFWVYGFGLQVL